jgi:hypothetical protein
MITEGAGLIRRPAVQEDREPDEKQCECICGVVRFIGNLEGRLSKNRDFWVSRDIKGLPV